MALKDSDVGKDYHEAYQQAAEKWWPWWIQAKKDLQYKLGDQWSERDKTRLKRQDRDPLKYNRCRRMVNLLSGYERKNRLSIKVNTVEGGDREVAEQMSGTAQWVMNYAQAYNVLSDAFEKGSVTTGLNLVELFVDYSRDPVNGDIWFNRLAYNQFLLDPFFTKLSLEDCNYILRRDWLSESQVKMILPEYAKEISKIQAKGRDQKFPDVPSAKDYKGKNLYRYDQFYRRDTKQVYLLIDKKSGQTREMDLKKKEMEEWLLQPVVPVEQQQMMAAQGMQVPMQAMMPRGEMVEVEQIYKPTVKLGIIVEDETFHDDEDPSGLDDYPLVPFMGYFEPDIDDWALRVSGVIRDMRDPQTESNRRRLKMLDMMDNMMRGLKVKENALVNRADAYLRGPLTLFINDAADMNDVQEIPPIGATPGIFESIQLMDKDIEEIPGGNETLMGLPNKDDAQEAWVMGKLRMQAGLTIFEPLMDNHRYSMKQLGTKVLKLIQQNFTAQKVQKITNKPVKPAFFDPDFGKYDVLPTQGLLTESQRQMRYAQLIALKNMNIPIPNSMILEASDLELSTEMIERQKQMEGMQQQIMMGKIQLEAQRAQAETGALVATAEEKKAKAQQAMAKAAELMSKVQGIPYEKMMQLMQMAIDLDKGGGFGMQGSLPAPEGAEGKPPAQMITKR